MEVVVKTYCYKNYKIRIISIVLIFIFIMPVNVWAVSDKLNKLETIEKNIDTTAKFMLLQTSNPTVGSIGGEWTIMCLARSGYNVPQNYYNKYYKNVENYVKEKKGILHKRKYTEYSRVVLALTAIGKNPHNVVGYDLVEPLGDYEKVIFQGINGPIFALIALDSGNYDMPVCKSAKIQATRQMYIDYILAQQVKLDGGFSLLGDKGDPDITGMALQALSSYIDQPKVELAIQKALDFLQNSQNADAGYSSWGSPTLESVAQVIMALTALDINPHNKKYIKNGDTVIDNLLTYYTKNGGFMHIRSSEKGNGGADAGLVSAMSTDQGMYAMIAYRNYYLGKNSFYNMSDVNTSYDNSNDNYGKFDNNKYIILGKIRISGIISPNKNFIDIDKTPYQKQILELTRRGILSGVSDNLFKPNNVMTRAEFCVLLVNILDLKLSAYKSEFLDVKKGDWFYSYVNTAREHRLVSGKRLLMFDPQGKITRQEAAVLLYNIADRFGVDKKITSMERNIYLSSYVDFVDIPDWSKNALTFCIKNKMIDINKPKLEPQEVVTRAEIAHMTYMLLVSAGL